MPFISGPGWSMENPTKNLSAGILKVQIQENLGPSCGGMFKKQKESQSNKSLVDKSPLNKSLVDKSLESDEYFDAGDGVEITKLAMRCVDYYPEEGPMMKEVVRCLRELNVVKKSSHIVVPNKMSVGSSGGDGILLHE